MFAGVTHVSDRLIWSVAVQQDLMGEIEYLTISLTDKIIKRSMNAFYLRVRLPGDSLHVCVRQWVRKSQGKVQCFF